MLEQITRQWIRNPGDQKAFEAGCRFDVVRAAFACHWVGRFCRLYQGDKYAGQPLLLRGCHECGDYGLPVLVERDWDDDAQAIAVERARRFAACVAVGHRVDWQYDCTMRIFGWIRYSDHWRRWIRRFRQVVVFIAKKNKKSPTLAAWGMYLLAGDGEPGQCVYFGAKDGTQARKIAATHAFEMRERSPELKELLKSNLNQMSLKLADGSILEPLSSSNSRTQQSKEGLNGSMLIDEIHVVDREFMGRISRAGISRSEPLQIEVSTAGDNPDGYGKERFDYAAQVLAGTIDNQELFAAIYAAPQDLTDADLDLDPLKFGRMANPAMGHTVDPEEFLHDYHTSKLVPTDFVRFKKYRVNIWQRASNPWLRDDHWQKCRRKFLEKHLYGRPCWAGLDLSRVRDLSALVLVFPFGSRETGVFLLLAYFWIPEARAKELADKASFEAWAKAGQVQITPGDVVDFGFIKTKFRELAKLFDIREFAFDPYFAEELSQAIEQGTCDDKGNTIEEGTGIPRFAFIQDDKNFAVPTQDLESLIRSGRIRHNGNAVLTWQIGHAHVIIRSNKVKRVVKPSKDDYRTVDGVIAAIMGLARAMLRQEPATPGAMVL